MLCESFTPRLYRVEPWRKQLRAENEETSNFLLVGMNTESFLSTDSDKELALAVSGFTKKKEITLHIYI